MEDIVVSSHMVATICWGYRYRSDQAVSQDWIKEQHTLVASRSQMSMGAKPPYPTYNTIVMGSSTVYLMKESLYIKFK